MCGLGVVVVDDIAVSDRHTSTVSVDPLGRLVETPARGDPTHCELGVRGDPEPLAVPSDPPARLVHRDRRRPLRPSNQVPMYRDQIGASRTGRGCATVVSGQRTSGVSICTVVRWGEP